MIKVATYSYKLYKNGKQEETGIKQRYTKLQLSRLTTYQLREICIKEKLVKDKLSQLNREALIHLIMSFRGADETYFINSYMESGIQQLESLLQYTPHEILREQNLKAPSKINIYDTLGITINDNYKMMTNQILTEGNVLLVDEHYRIATIFNLIALEKEYYLVKDKRVPMKETTRGQYYLLYFQKKDSDIIYDTYYNNQHFKPTYLHFYRLPILEFKICQIEKAIEPLVIDFGTCNTTVGTYQEREGIEVLKVVNQLKDSVEITSLIPSVIGIKTINEEKIEYIFGYEAIKVSQSNYIKEGIHIFYDIKRWVSDYEREERLTSETGQHIWVKRKELLRAYFEYIIELAETYFKMKFKTLQFLMPVRQKKKFELLLQEVLPEYMIITNLDEGSAVLFNTLSEVIEKENYMQRKSYKALIMDCGGGTTDLTACEFKIENKRVAYHIEMQTSYENGDTNFGGNNLTYRLMQFLKLTIINQLNSEFNIYDLFEEEVFSYERFNKLYVKGERILPTRFKDYENASVQEYFKVKQNFYYLFMLAEEIKKVFFKTAPLYEIELGLEEKEEGDIRKNYIQLDKWKLSVLENGELKYLIHLKPISIYRYEVYYLMRKDIYQLIERLLLPFYEGKALTSYQIIKLTGQSCQVEIFKEALKEFIPGKLLSYKKDGKDLGALKLGCLHGAIKYYRAIKLGYMAFSRNYIGAAFPYEVSGYSHQNQEKVLIHRLQKNEHTGFISRFKTGETLNLYLKDTNDKVLRTYAYSYERSDFELTTYYDIEEKYKGKIMQSETDNIENEEIKFFVWVDEIEWGFYVLPVLREEELLYSGQLTFFDFENDTWEENFFDGNK